MENKQEEYHISFFKPTTEQAKKNRNLTIILVIIWAICIFGFQFLLKIIEKPTPEPTYNEFISVWENVKNGTATETELQVFSKSSLMVLGKSSIKPEHRNVLDNGFSWAVYNLCDSANKDTLVKQIASLIDITGNLTSVQDEEYLTAKSSLSKLVSEIINTDANSVIGKLIPLELTNDYKEFSEENKSSYSQIMGLYLIHNQSVLTDFTFLGFPFHYFYTAVFLLILFVALCWVYCYKTDKMNEKLGIEATN